MTVGYAGGGSHIDFVLCALRPEPLPALDDNEVSLAPTIDIIIPLLGRRWQDPALREVFVPLGLDWHSRDTAEGRVADFVRHTAWSWPSVHMPVVSSSHMSSSTATASSRRASGGEGCLFGIEFDDSPEVLQRKVTFPSDTQVDKDFTGFLAWHLEKYSLRVFTAPWIISSCTWL